MSKFKFVIVAKDENFKMLSYDFKDFHDIANVITIANNTLPITSVYNKYIDETRQLDDCDFLIFMHADVHLDVKSLIDHIEECKDKYDVMGLCGTSVMNVSQSPLNWWTGSNPTPYAKYGYVKHGELGNKDSFFNADRPNETDHEAACIDGLCIIFGKNALKSEMKFDEQFLYDFYDTDISFQTILTYKLKLGVIVEKSLYHYSVGKSITTQDFLMHEIDFRNKWNIKLS